MTLPRVGASVALRQDNLNLLLCLYLNPTSFRSFNSSLSSLKLITMIFSSIHKFNQPLKLFTVEDCLCSSLLVGGGCPQFLTLQIFRQSDLVSKSWVGEKISVIIQSLFPIPSGDTYINPLPIIIMFHGGNARLVYDVLRVESSAQGAFPFTFTVTRNHIVSPIYNNIYSMCATCLYIYIYIYTRGAFRVNVIVIRSGLSHLSSIPGRGGGFPTLPC